MIMKLNFGGSSISGCSNSHCLTWWLTTTGNSKEVLERSGSKKTREEDGRLFNISTVQACNNFVPANRRTDGTASQGGLGWIARKKRIGIIGNGMTGKAAKQEKQQTSKNDRSILKMKILSYTK